MKIKIFVGFVLGVALTSALMLSTNVEAIVQNPVPVITSVAPNSGYTTGGEAVTITGRYLDGVNSVLLDTDSVQIQTVSAEVIVVTVPAHSAGFVDVTVTNSDGSATAENAYEYVIPPPPSVISLIPSSGSIEGETAVTIAGEFLAEVQSVTFDGLPATINSTSNTQVLASTPAHDAGIVDVVVTSPYGISTIVSAYEYIDDTPPPPPMPPSISSLDPSEGPIEGGTEVTIDGNNLDTVNSVLFGGEEATIIRANTTELVVSSPAHVVGLVNVIIENPDGSTVFENGFTYTEVINPPAYVYCDWHDNGNNWFETKKNNKHNKALVCHEQSKPKDTFKTLCLPLEAIPAHLAHGDEAGYCSGDEPEGYKYKSNEKEGGKKKDDTNKSDDNDKKDDKKSSWKFWKK